MCRTSQSAWWRSALAAAVLFSAAYVSAADRPVVPRGQSSPPGETVEMFAAMGQGQIEVQFIPRDSAKANLLVTNKTDRPLTVKLPPAFAAAPVLAQWPPLFGQPNNNNRRPPMPNQPNQPNQNSRNNAPDNQRVGGGSPIGVFSIAPERTAQVKVDTVCLDHGKPNPRAAIPYQIKPLNEVSDKQGVAEICEMLGRGELGQRVAQLAAWHFSNDMSWEQIAGLRDKTALGTTPSYSKKELASAKKAAEKALDLAKRRAQPGTTSQAAR